VQGRSRGGRGAVGVLALVVVLLLGVGAWWVMVGAPRASAQAAAETADAFLAAWGEEDWPAVVARVRPPTDGVVDAHRSMLADLGVTAATFEPEEVAVDGSTAVVDYVAELELAGFGPLSYAGRLDMVRTDGAWQVSWDPSVLHPALVPGGRFTRSRDWPARGRIVDVAGEPLVGGSSIIVVGVEPQRITDRDAVVRALVDAAGASEDAVRELLDRPDLRGDWFYPVVELTRNAFDAADDALRPVPGILFREAEGRGGPLLAPGIVGRAAPVTEELLEELGAPYEEGDVAGVSGIERALEDRLAGSPALRAAVVGPEGEELEVLTEVEAVPGEDVQLTLDPRWQRAAEEALQTAPAPAALVAIDIPSGGLRAVANAPGGGFDRALAGRYPPGSTFKVITSAALLGLGVGTGDTLDCPAEQAVGGRRFRNAGGMVLGPITHRVAFARSCNTAYVGQAGRLADGALMDAARAFGFVDPVDSIPLPHFRASFPEPVDLTELAAASIGQGRVEASVAHMASVAAATATGTWRAPIIVVGDEQETRPLPGDVAAMGEMMRAVVTEGTGTAAAVPGPPVAGKTGSAEFGGGSPPPTHAWFIGFRGDVAFAVVVEGGGAGGAVAAPLAARFLALLG
jgi:cell division protein FtsI/penicillin-binding protein 2